MCLRTFKKAVLAPGHYYGLGILAVVFKIIKLKKPWRCLLLVTDSQGSYRESVPESAVTVVWDKILEIAL
jgi:hypothetical protein